MSESTPLLPLNVHKGISNWEAGYHIVCVIAGTGLLQIPYAFSKAGWIGIVFLMVSAGVNIYTGGMIIDCLYANDKELEGYPDIGREAFGKYGYLVVSVCYNTAMCGTVCLYLILAGMNLAELIGYFSERNWIIVISMMILIPFLSVKTLKEVAVVSFLGSCASVAVVTIVSVVGYMDYDNYVGKVTHQIANPREFGSVLATLSFAFGANYVYPEIHKTMAKPQDFHKVLRYSIILITIMYLLIGITGYMTYGNLAISPILYNLPHGLPKTLGLAIITFHVISACPLLLTTISRDMERDFDIVSEKGISSLRLLIICSACLLSIFLPFFTDMLSLIGAVSNTMLIFVLPIACEFALLRKSNVIVGMMILIVGLIGGAVGTFDASIALWNDIIKSFAVSI